MVSSTPTPTPTPTSASVQSRVSTLLHHVKDGVTVFAVTPRSVEPLTLTEAFPPLLTCEGTSHQLARVLDCFVRWEGAVRVAALQDEGLLDVWVI